MTDAAIQAAWDRRAAAYEAYNLLPYDEAVGEYTPEEAAQWAIIDEAEKVIRSTVATSPIGVAIQLWTSLAHSLGTRDDEAATLRRDLQYFDEREIELDWTDRLVIAAIRSLANQPVELERA